MHIEGSLEGRMRSQRALTLSAIAFLGLAAAACDAPKSKNAAPGGAPIRVAGYEGINSATPFFVAQKLGYFKEAGLEVSYVTMASGAPALAAALKTGDIDVGLGAASQWMSDYARGAIQGKIIGELTDNNYVILGGKGITDVRQLKGKVFAISAHNGGDHLYSQAVLAHYGVGPDALTWLPMGSPASRLIALQTGKVDATELTLTNLPASARGQVIVTADASPVPFVSSAIFARQALLQSNRPALQKFLAAIGKASVWIRAHPTEAVQACQESGSDAEGCKIAIQAAISAKNDYTWSQSSRVNTDAIRAMLPIVASVVPQAKTLTVADVVDTSVAAVGP
jgi:NitT/TauT family transport system substrate-binding protein